MRLVIRGNGKAYLNLRMMGHFKVEVDEFGLKKNGKITPAHYTWDYCALNRIPNILFHSKSRYSRIEIDFLSIDPGIDFKGDLTFGDFWKDTYNKYVKKNFIPENRSRITDNRLYCSFYILKRDQIEIAQKLLVDIGRFVKEFGMMNPECRAYFEQCGDHGVIQDELDH